jgi:hypothetical protein
MIGSTAFTTAESRPGVRQVTWADLVPLHRALEERKITSATFASYVERVHDTNLRRVRDGDLDHLVFYTLQSTHFTTLPPIEPALSAKAFVEALDDRERATFFGTSQAPPSRIPGPVRLRVASLIHALDSNSTDPRLKYFRTLVNATVPDRREREAAVLREYLRVMRFVYEKEFVAQRGAGSDAVAELYRTRGLSTDTAVEAGYLVYLGLGVIKSLEPTRRLRRVLIVGPGLDLAPRTSLLEVGPPESYQPWAVIDALLAFDLSTLGDLEVVAADINPRVVEHVRQSAGVAPILNLVTGLAEGETVTFSEEYRDYFTRLGRAIDVGPGDRVSSRCAAGHLCKTLQVRPAAASVLSAETLDVVTERLERSSFDLIIATNILPYFDDTELMLAMSNIAGMLTPGGVFLHNEARPLMGDVTAALGMPFEQSRHVVIASVRGAPAPLGDSAWLHRKVSR